MSWISTHRRFVTFLTVVALQVIVVAAATAREEYYRRSGEQIVVRTVPVDPFDLLRGQYVILSYAFENPPDYFRWSYVKGDTVYVVLRRQGKSWRRDGYEDSVPSRSSRDPDTVYLKGRATSGFGQLRVAFPNLSRYYVREGTRAPRTPPDVVLSVRGDGTARIVRLAIHGKTWP
jgi:uncharacterized membrane-anchored protein